MAYLIKTNGAYEERYDLTLENMQEAVGGFIQIITSYDGKTCFVCNEDGKQEGLQKNDEATRLAHECGALWVHDYLVGDVIMTAADAIE